MQLKYHLQMKRNLGSLGLLFSTLLLLASCLGKDSEETVLYNDAAITSFQISTAKIYYHTTSKTTGEDSTYAVTNTSMSSYVFDIDQNAGTISNTDSLPLGTDASKLLCSYSTKNNGVAAIKSLSSDSIRILLTTDSTDFTRPRTLYVYSSNGENMRTYTVKVNVHQEYADSFHWSQLPLSAEVAALSSAKAFYVGGKVMLVGSDGQSTKIYTTTDGSAWTMGETTLSLDACNNAALKGDTLFVVDNNCLKYTTDGNAFTTVAGADDLRLVGATTDELYAYGKDNGMKMSEDGGRSWTDEVVDDDVTLLPTEDISFCCLTFAHSDSADYAIMAGSRADYDQSGSKNDSLYMGKAVVWRKIVERSQIKEEGKWIFLGPEIDNGYTLPRMASLNIFGYDGKIMAFGGTGKGTCSAEAYSKFYISSDGGITWKGDSRFKVPTAFDKTATGVAVTTDGDGYIWLICGGTGQVWRGRLNSMGWQK